MIQKAFKFRIYPNKEQEILFLKHFGCTRFIYNWGLQTKIKSYEQDKSKKISCFELINLMKHLKTEKEWLSEVNSQCLQMSLRNLDNAFTRFFKQKKGFPNFKKKQGHQSFQCPQFVNVNFENNTTNIPKIKDIKTKFSRQFTGKIKTCTVSKTPTNKYYVSILVEVPEELPNKPDITDNRTIGVDLGIKHFAVLSDGTKIDNSKFLKKSTKKLKYAQYKLSKMDNINKKKGEKYTKNRQKQKLRLAKVHERIANQRNDFLHKLTYALTHNNQVDNIAVEDLNVSGMIKNHKLARAISDVSWSKFREFLTYKCEWYGKNLIFIGRFEPSSKLCSNCGVKNIELALDIREWVCDNCHALHDRDINAAVNIKKFALIPQNLLTNKEYIALEQRESTPAGECSVVRTSLKQESPLL